MKLTTPVPGPSWLAALAFLVLSAERTGDEVGFHPGAGSSAEKRFQTDCELVLDDLRVLMNGEEADPSMLGLPADLSVSFGYLLECLDEYKEVADGRPTELLRSFESFEMWSVDPDGTETREGDGTLEGNTIRFLWDEDEERYQRSFVEEDADEEALEFMAEDLDLRALLPDDEVDAGERWDVSGFALASILVPSLDMEELLNGGDVGDIPAEVLTELETFLEDASAKCTFEGIEEEEERSLARILIEGTMESSVDVDPATVIPDDGGMEVEDAHLEISIELEIEGACLWDLEAGRFHSFEMEAYGSILVDGAVSVSQLGMDLEATAELALNLDRTATAE